VLSCQNECERAESKLNEGENGSDFVLAPSAFFKVVMNGCHFEKTLAVCEFEVNRLHQRRK
jgi:hypothetical protein